MVRDSSMNHYEQLVQKQAALSELVAKLAAENRAPSPEEKSQLDTIQSEIKTIREDFESAGRKAFLQNLAPAAPKPALLTKDMSFAEHIKGSYAPEQEKLSLGRLLNGYINNDWTGAELEQKTMASSPTTAGGVLIPSVLSARIIDMARNQAVCMRAGATVVPMTSNNLKVARATGDVTAAWYSPNSLISESDAAFDSVDFTARKLACWVRIENELLADAQGVDAALEGSIAKAIALEMDRVGLHGSGAAPEPQGINGASGIQTMTNVGTLADYSKFLDAIYDIRALNYEPNAIVYSSYVASKIAKLVTGISGDKTTLVPPPDFAALTKFVSNQCESGSPLQDVAFLGDWSYLWYGIRQNIQLEVARQGGQTNDVFAYDQSLFRATVRMDVQLAQPGAFLVMNGIV
jgi:HK97 family phage major capsid protein